MAAARAHVSLGFFDGASLADPEGTLEGRGKRMRHVKVRKLDDVRAEQFASWVREAVALNAKTE